MFRNGRIFNIEFFNGKLRHDLLLDMALNPENNSDHDGRYYTETETDALFLKLDASNDPLQGDLDFGGNDILSSGALGFKVSGDNNDYLSWSTVANVPTTTIVGGLFWELTSDQPEVGAGFRIFGDNGFIVLNWDDATEDGSVIANGSLSLFTLDNGDISLSPHGTGITTVNSDTTITGVATIEGLGTGGQTDYDLKVGDTDGSPTYGMIQIGNACIGRTSFKAGNIDLDGAIIYRNISGPVTSEIEHVFVESTGDTTRFALAKAGVGNATYNSRSMLIAGPAPADTDYVKVSYWQTNNNIFDNLACDTSGVGADLGVQNDLEVEGNIFVDSIKESTPGAGISVNFDDIVEPDNIDGTIDPTAITDLSETLFWTLNGVLTATTGGADLVKQAGTEDYCDRGTFKAHDFDGSTYYKATGVEGPLGGAVRTTLCWMKTDASGTGNRRIMEYGTGQTWSWLINTTTNIMGVVSGASFGVSVADARLSDGEWHLLAAVLRNASDDFDEIEWWIDGVEIAADAGSAVAVNTGTNTDTWVGASSAGATIINNCMGLVAVFDTALTQANMQNIYDRQKTKTIAGSDGSSRDVSDMADDISTLGSINIQSGTIVLDQATGDVTATGNMTFGNAAGDTHNLFGTVTMGATGGAGNEVEVDGTTGLMTFNNTAGIPYGECHQADGATFTVTMTTINVWVEVDAATTNITATELNNVTFPDDHYLLCPTEGRYFVTYSMTGDINSVAGGDQHIESGIMVNGSIQTDKGIGHEQYAAISREKNLQGHTIIDVPANGQISLALKNTTSGSKILTIDHVNITVMQVGGT